MWFVQGSGGGFGVSRNIAKSSDSLAPRPISKAGPENYLWQAAIALSTVL